MTFIIPAEIFPTCYRCTCHGISAAAGKLGSILAVLIVYAINKGYDSPSRQGLIFLLFGSVAVLGAFFSWAYLPNSQRRVVEPGGNRDVDRIFLETKTLEELGEGRVRARQSGELTTFTDKWTELRNRKKTRAFGQDSVGPAQPSSQPQSARESVNAAM